MDKTHMVAAVEQQNYFDRNLKWLLPLIVAFILLATPALLNGFPEPGAAAHAPSAADLMGRKVAAWAALFAVLMAGIGARRTHTRSAMVFQFVAGGVALTTVVVYVVRALSN